MKIVHRCCCKLTVILGRF